MNNQNKYLNTVLSHSDHEEKEIEIESENKFKFKIKNKTEKGKEKDEEPIQSTSKRSTSNIIDLTLDSPPINTNKRSQSNSISTYSHHQNQNQNHVKKLKQTTLSNCQSKTPEPDHLTKPASSSSASPLDLDEELACPICCELFVSPVNFACGHSFCGSCAHDWLEKESVCPSCRQESTSPPARLYILESIIQKYFDHQLSALRSEGKVSEALAMELEREEKLNQWTNRRALLDSAARLKPNHQIPLGLQAQAGLFVQHDPFPPPRGLNLPGIEGFGLHPPPHLYQAPAGQAPATRHGHFPYPDHYPPGAYPPPRHRRHTPQPGPAPNPRAGPSNARSASRTWLH
ncbi:hypothetical protein DFH28DRAFT_1064847 [Melampsora americana]|nr:hypothetical protein DFH28DRAFT_1064847 [Melampsora americana]